MGSAGSGTAGAAGSAAPSGGSDAQVPMPDASAGSHADAAQPMPDASASTNDASDAPPSSDASDDEDTAVPSGRHPAFIAVGHMGRTTLSCDDGRSWIANASIDDGVRCFEGLDCDHTSGAGRGLAYGHGVFVASFGWGEPGRLAYSKDGVTWSTGRDETIFAGVAFGNGVFVANASTPLISSDGQNWLEASGDLGLNVGNTRAIGFAAHDGGRFVVTGESGDARDVVLSTDDGQTWTHGSARPDECVGYVRGLAYGAGAIVAASGNGFVCTSTDGGDTWSVHDVDDRITSNIVYSGGEFMVWSGSMLHTSRDGMEWDDVQAMPNSVSIGPVAVSPSGTFVSSNDGWLVWYEQQEFYRSEDGIAWEVLDASKFTGSHPINFMAYGEVDTSDMGCSGAP